MLSSHLDLEDGTARSRMAWCCPGSRAITTYLGVHARKLLTLVEWLLGDGDEGSNEPHD